MSLVRTLRAAIVLGLRSATGPRSPRTSWKPYPGRSSSRSASRDAEGARADRADAQADSGTSTWPRSVGGAIRKLRVRGDVSTALRNLIGQLLGGVRERTTSCTRTPSPTTAFGVLVGAEEHRPGYRRIAGTAEPTSRGPAWTVTPGPNTVVVGVVDTGISYTHPDLAANVGRTLAGSRLRGRDARFQRHQQQAAIRWTTTTTAATSPGHHRGRREHARRAGRQLDDSIMASSSSTPRAAGRPLTPSPPSIRVNAKIAGVNVRVLSKAGAAVVLAGTAGRDQQGQRQRHPLVAAAGTTARQRHHAALPVELQRPERGRGCGHRNTDALASCQQLRRHSVHLGAPGKTSRAPCATADSRSSADVEATRTSPVRPPSSLPGPLA